MALSTGNAFPTILDAKEVASILKKAPKWVYNHADKLGGRKIGGSLFFTMEGVCNAIQRQGRLARRGQGGREEGGAEVVPIKAGRFRVGKDDAESLESERETIARRAGLTEFLR